MSGDLARKRPAEVMPARKAPAPPGMEPLEVWGPEPRYTLLHRIRRATARGEIVQAGAWEEVSGWPGYYIVEVRRLKQPVPAWRRAGVWGLAAIPPLATVGALIYAFLPAILMGLFILAGSAAALGMTAVIVRIRRGSAIVIQQNVTIQR